MCTLRRYYSDRAWLNISAAGDQFWSAVAIDGETVVVGVPGDDDGKGLGSGSAYVFVRLGGSWSQQQKLLASDGPSGSGFGDSVAIGGDTVVVSAPAEHRFGSAYIFVRDAKSTWIQRIKLIASNGAAGDRLGSSVAATRDTVVVGASLDEVDGAVDMGSAYIYDFGFADDGQTCTENNECYSNGCLLGTCCHSPCGDTCKTCATGSCKEVSRFVDDTEGAFTCLSTNNETCDGRGGCKRTNGQVCVAAQDCASGHCADGVCCDTACADACLSCAIAGKVGSCSPLDGARDVDSCAAPCQICRAGICSNVDRFETVAGRPSCEGAQACDGQGGCKKKTGEL